MKRPPGAPTFSTLKDWVKLSERLEYGQIQLIIVQNFNSTNRLNLVSPDGPAVVLLDYMKKLKGKETFVYISPNKPTS